MTLRTISPILPEVWTQVLEDTLIRQFLGFADPSLANYAIRFYDNVDKPRDYAIVSVVELAPGIIACLDTDREYVVIFNARHYKVEESWAEYGENILGIKIGVLVGHGFIPHVSSFSEMLYRAKEFISHRDSDDPIPWHEPIRSEVVL